MQLESNPYQSPAESGAQEAAPVLRRPAAATFLLGLWLLEGSVKACIVGAALAQGLQPCDLLAREYAGWSRISFLLVASFLLVETIGPWIGVYYLTGRRSRTIPIEKATFRILVAACSAALILTLGLMLCLELTALAGDMRL